MLFKRLTNPYVNEYINQKLMKKIAFTIEMFNQLVRINGNQILLYNLL